jgi:hypothetical protein
VSSSRRCSLRRVPCVCVPVVSTARRPRFAATLPAVGRQWLLGVCWVGSFVQVLCGLCFLLSKRIGLLSQSVVVVLPILTVCTAGVSLLQARQVQCVLVCLVLTCSRTPACSAAIANRPGSSLLCVSSALCAAWAHLLILFISSAAGWVHYMLPRCCWSCSAFGGAACISIKKHVEKYVVVVGVGGYIRAWS